MSDAESDTEVKEEGPVLGTYTGDRNEAKERHGQGKNVFPNGDVYTGSYANGKRSGHGFYKWKSGHRYVGDYVDNVREGAGSMIYPDGTKYKGQFVKGKRHGQGVYTYANGDAYDGEWENDFKNGKGTYTYQASGSKKSGTWVQGKLSGPGEIHHADTIISGKFSGNENMEMPVKVIFNSTGYEKTISSPAAINMEQVAPVS